MANNPSWPKAGSPVAIATVLGLGLSVILILARVISYRSLLIFPGARLTLAEAIASLFAAGAVFAWSSSALSSRSASALGIAGGLLLVAHLALEDFAPRIGESGPLTLAVMAITFATWSTAGYRGGRFGNPVRQGIASACLAALTSVTCAIAFGLALTFWDVPSARYVATWPEYQASGWGDARAFSIVNTIGAASTHVLTALLLAPILGMIAAVIARTRRSR